MGAPAGVRGWLLLFCVVLTFLNPASIAYQMVVALRLGLDVVGTVYVLGYSAIALFSLTAGLFLWQVRPNAVTTAKIFLLTQAAFAVALWMKVLLGAAKTPDSAAASALGILFRPLLFAVIWYAYLTKSKRVQATYPMDYSVVTKKI
jgi:hypothetical protein